MAEDFTQKILRLNYLAFQAGDIHVQMMMAANMTKNDVLFVVSTSGQTKEILRLMTVAQERGRKSSSSPSTGSPRRESLPISS
ncbi:SIS domain-containing protein [Rossellomorea sp. H39__3]